MISGIPNGEGPELFKFMAGTVYRTCHGDVKKIAEGYAKQVQADANGGA